MPVEIKLPHLGDGIDSGDVLEVLVREGDQIEKDQGIVELETDKATVAVPAPQAGIVAKVHVSEGETIPVGGVLITLEPTNGAAAAPPSEPKQSAADSAKSERKTDKAPAASPAGRADKAEKSAAKTPPPQAAPDDVDAEAADETAPPRRSAARGKSSKSASDKSATDESRTKRGGKSRAKSRETEEESTAEPAGDAATDSAESRPSKADIAAGPAMRRFAREVGVDLASVTGTGPGGRITRNDILQVVRSGQGRSTGARDAATERDAYGPIRRERLSKIRRTIAEKMHESWSTVPRVTNFDDADVTDLENIRQASKEDYAARDVKLTTLPFVVKACAMALRNHPVINSSIDLDANQVIYKQYINIGIAMDTDRGLIVPALRGVDDMSIPEIARALTVLTERVRDGEYSVEDLRGGTFTISNLGAIGGTYSTPIVNIPETTIVLVGRSRKMPIVYNDQIVPRLMMPLSISYDHRLVDGAAAARFLNEVISYLEAPSRLLLAP
jgi:pyruvate/2-oxoglutarate dehydrogenase complex dihydrolipoamide acyltransferase (E2) component